ncbi:MAG: hypothetical protein JO045_00355 [Mycobacterium sp.]|nr:hypothetical protein [Mycobacterium sp.]
MTTAALVIVGRITAQGTGNAVNQITPWLNETQATAAVATTLSVFIALYVTVVRDPRRAAEEARRREARMDTLRRAVRERIAAQARKVVPSCVRTAMFGDLWWTVRIDNAGRAVMTLLNVDVEAVDANGIAIPNGCQQANNTMRVDQAFDRSILALSGSLEGRFQQSTAVKQALRDAVVGHFATEWKPTLSPNQHTVMAYTTTKPDYTLRVTIDYEDEAGYQWRRTDTSQPERIGRDPLA